MNNEFIEMFKETLDIEEDIVQMDTKFRDLKQWDSIAFLSIISMIDDEYDVVIDGNYLKNLTTIGELIDEINKNASINEK